MTGITTPICGPICGPVVGAITERVAGAWSPNLLPTGPKNAWWQLSDLSYVFQDAAGTIPVTAVGDPVGRINDKFGNAANYLYQDTDANRPLLGVDDFGVRCLKFVRASSQYLNLANLSMFSDIPGAYVGQAIAFGNVTLSNLAALYVSLSSSATSMFLFMGITSGQPAMSIAARRLTTDTTKTIALGNANAGQAIVMSAQMKYANDAAYGYINGELVNQLTPFQGAGNSMPAAAAAAFVGRFSTAYFTGNVYEQIVCSPSITDAQRAQADKYLKKNCKPSVSEINVLLVGGQSNADGRAASSSGPTWIQDNVVDGVLAWSGAYISAYNLTVTGASGNGASWVDSGSSGNFSFADIACHAVAQGASNLLVCRVTNGSSVLAPVDDVSGSWNADYASIPAGTPKLLQALQNRYADLVAYCADNSIAINVRGLVWHQGERDEVEGTQSTYATNFAAMVAKVRDFTGVADLPIYYGTISHVSTQYDATIEAAQLDFAANDANAYCRDNSALTLLGDGLHFDASSCETFGADVAAAILARLP